MLLDGVRELRRVSILMVTGVSNCFIEIVQREREVGTGVRIGNCRCLTQIAKRSIDYHRLRIQGGFASRKYRL